MYLQCSRNRASVLQAMGWDAVRLPAKYAEMQQIKEQKRGQFRLVVTCNPEYYRWTQKLILMFREDALRTRKWVRSILILLVRRRWLLIVEIRCRSGE